MPPPVPVVPAGARAALFQRTSSGKTEGTLARLRKRVRNPECALELCFRIILSIRSSGESVNTAEPLERTVSITLSS